MKRCTVCGDPACCRGLCMKHYTSQRRHGDPNHEPDYAWRFKRAEIPTYAAVHLRLQRDPAVRQKVQDTLNAQQDVKTATQQRLASEQRAMQPAPDLKVAIFNCLNEQVKEGKDPAGCWSNIGGTPLIEMPKP